MKHNELGCGHQTGGKHCCPPLLWFTSNPQMHGTLPQGRRGTVLKQCEDNIFGGPAIGSMSAHFGRELPESGCCDLVSQSANESVSGNQVVLQSPLPCFWRG